MLPSREQRLVGGYLGQDSVEGLVLHCDTARQGEDGLLFGHGRPYTSDASEVAVEPFYPVSGVYHALYLWRIRGKSGAPCSQRCHAGT